MRRVSGNSLFLFLWLLACSISSRAQGIPAAGERQLDSLTKEANKLSGPDRVDLLNNIAFSWFGYNNSKAKEVLIVALEESEKIGYDKGKSESLVYWGLYERIAGNTEVAFRYFKEGIALAKKSGNIGAEGYGLVQMGNLMNRHGNFDSALIFYNQSYAVLKDSVAPMQLSVLYRNLGNFYGVQGDRNKQRIFLFRSMRIREALNEKFLLSDIYVMIASYFSAELNFDEALVYINKAEEVNKTDSESESLYDLKYQKANILMRQSKYLEALQIFNEIKIHYREVTSKEDNVKLLTDIGYSMMDLGNYEISLNNYYEALQIADENNFELDKAKLYWQIGYVYVELKQYDLAKQFAEKCLNASIKNQFKVEEGTATNLLGIVYHAIEKYDSSLYYYRKSLELREEVGDRSRIASTLNNIGIVLAHQKKYQESLRYQLRSYKIQEENNDRLGMAWGLHTLGELYLNMGDLTKAKSTLDQAEAISINVHAKQVLVPVYLLKAKWFELKGNDAEALVYYKKYEAVKDSIYNTSLSNRVAGLQNEFEILQKNQQIEILKKNNEIHEREIQIQQDKVKQQGLIIFFGAGFLIVVFIGAFIVYRNYEKVRMLNREIQENNEEIQAQTEELQLSNQTIVQMNEKLEGMVETRTKELKQAYKELDTFFYRSSHDFRRPLTTFMGLAEVANITIKDKSALELFEKVNETARNLDKMLMKLQSISDMGSQQLAYKEIFIKEIFEAELDLFRDVIRDHHVKVTIDVASGISFYSYPALIKIICDNLIENAIFFRKESDNAIKLSAFPVEGGTKIKVEDQGQGIDPEYMDRIFDMYFRANERSKGNGLGLYIVKKVTEKLQGTVHLTSTKGAGTTVTIFIPNNHNFKA